jgi:hypothetical protein
MPSGQIVSARLLPQVEAVDALPVEAAPAESDVQAATAAA